MEHMYISLNMPNMAWDITKLFYKTNRQGKFSVTVSAVESRNKIQKQLKDMLLKDICPRKVKTIVSNFYQLLVICVLNHISSSLIMQKKKKKEILICNFVSSETFYFNYQLHELDFCLLYNFLSSENTSFKKKKKKKLLTKRN